jgi:hypothetical protein
VARLSNCRSHHSCRCPVLRVLCEEPALSEVEGAGTTTAYTTDGVERTGVASAESPTLCKKRKDGAPSVGMVQCKDGPPAHRSVIANGVYVSTPGPPKPKAPCHPERSKPIRKTNRFAKSKDPLPARATTSPTRRFNHAFVNHPSHIRSRKAVILRPAPFSGRRACPELVEGTCNSLPAPRASHARLVFSLPAPLGRLRSLSKDTPTKQGGKKVVHKL